MVHNNLDGREPLDISVWISKCADFDLYQITKTSGRLHLCFLRRAVLLCGSLEQDRQGIYWPQEGIEGIDFEEETAILREQPGQGHFHDLHYPQRRRGRPGCGGLHGDRDIRLQLHNTENKQDGVARRASPRRGRAFKWHHAGAGFDGQCQHAVLRHFEFGLPNQDLQHGGTTRARNTGLRTNHHGSGRPVEEGLLYNQHIQRGNELEHDRSLPKAKDDFQLGTLRRKRPRCQDGCQ